MPVHQERLVEVRLLVIVYVDVTSDDLVAALKGDRRQPSSVPEIVAAEVVSNLESVPYVDTAIVSHL